MGIYFFLFLKDFIYLVLENVEGKEKGRETSMCERNINRLPLTRPPTRDQAQARTGNRPCKLLLCWTMLNQLSHAGQGNVYENLNAKV